MEQQGRGGEQRERTLDQASTAFNLTVMANSQQEQTRENDLRIIRTTMNTRDSLSHSHIVHYIQKI